MVGPEVGQAGGTGVTDTGLSLLSHIAVTPWSQILPGCHTCPTRHTQISKTCTPRRRIQWIDNQQSWSTAMPDAHEQIAEIEAEIEALARSAERCRTFIRAGKVVAAAGALPPLIAETGLLTLSPMGILLGVGAVFGGIVIAGSNKGTLDELTEAFRACEALRAELIDGIELNCRRSEAVWPQRSAGRRTTWPSRKASTSSLGITPISATRDLFFLQPCFRRRYRGVPVLPRGDQACQGGTGGRYQEVPRSLREWDRSHSVPPPVPP